MKIFLDCGYYAGKALEYYAPLMDETWTVYVFEPNEALNVEETIQRFPFKVEWIKKAVWTKDGTAYFSLDEREDAARLSKIRKSTGKKVKVKTIDFSKFVKDLPEEATIVCSMDIEGAEYPVLRKLIKDGVIDRISLLDIEFHDRLLTDEDAATSSALRRELESLGVLTKLKI